MARRARRTPGRVAVLHAGDRLTYAQVEHTVVPDPLAALTHVPPGPVDVIGYYTAFRNLARRLAHDT